MMLGASIPCRIMFMIAIIGEGLLFLAVESALLKRFCVLRRQARFCSEVLKRFAEESRRADRAVVDALANAGLHDLDDGADERARSVILAAVAPGVAHVLDLGLVEVRELVFLGLGAEVQLVDLVDNLAQVVAALNLVLDLAEYLPNLVFDSVRAARLLLEAVQVGKELPVHEVAEVVAGQGLVVVEFAVLALGRGPAFPAIGLVEDVGVFLAVQRGFGALVLLKVVEVFQEQQPGGLLGVIELSSAASFFPRDVINVFEGLFEHMRRAICLGSYRQGSIIARVLWFTAAKHAMTARNA